jgi:hypothetical protein
MRVTPDTTDFSALAAFCRNKSICPPLSGSTDKTLGNVLLPVKETDHEQHFRHDFRRIQSSRRQGQPGGRQGSRKRKAEGQQAKGKD